MDRTSPHYRDGLRRGVCLAALALAVAATSANGGPLPKFTGYTRIGHPPTPKAGDKPEKIKGAEADDEKVLGVTIYYMVLDRKADRLGTTGDTWGAGVKGFDASFVSGRNSERERLDTEARYLYLYQLVNDRPDTRSAVKDLTVRILVDPRLVTSWGHFRFRETNRDARTEVKGAGFSMEFPNPRDRTDWLIRPVSTLFPGVSDKRYLNPAPAIQAPRPYGLLPISTGLIRDVADDAEIGEAPEDVLMVPNVDFGTDGPDPVYLKPALASDTEKLPGGDDPEARRRMRDQYRKRWPAVRAYWRDPDSQIKPRQRSTIFGFTCDFAPTLDTASVGGRSLGIGFSSRLDPSDLLPPASFVSVDRAAADRRGLTDRTREPAASDAVALAGPDLLRRLLAQRGAAGAAGPSLSGQLPTPAPPPGAVAPAVAAAPAEAPAESRGGFGGSGDVGSAATGSSFVAGADSSGGALAAAAFGGGSSGGGGSGGGSSGGGGSGVGGTGGIMQDQGMSGSPGTTVPGQGTTVTINGSNAAVATQAQAQAQAQVQVQVQAQTGDGNVIPAPPAWLLGLLGLPVFYFLARRRKVRPTGEGHGWP